MKAKRDVANEGRRQQVRDQMIGSLMYTVTGTRPDLAFTVTLLSQ